MNIDFKQRLLNWNDKSEDGLKQLAHELNHEYFIKNNYNEKYNDYFLDEFDRELFINLNILFIKYNDIDYNKTIDYATICLDKYYNLQKEEYDLPFLWSYNMPLILLLLLNNEAGNDYYYKYTKNKLLEKLSEGGYNNPDLFKDLLMNNNLDDNIHDKVCIKNTKEYNEYYGISDDENDNNDKNDNNDNNDDNYSINSDTDSGDENDKDAIYNKKSNRYIKNKSSNNTIIIGTINCNKSTTIEINERLNDKQNHNRKKKNIKKWDKNHAIYCTLCNKFTNYNLNPYRIEYGKLKNNNNDCNECKNILNKINNEIEEISRFRNLLKSEYVIFNYHCYNIMFNFVKSNNIFTDKPDKLRNNLKNIKINNLDTFYDILIDTSIIMRMSFIEYNKYKNYNNIYDIEKSINNIYSLYKSQISINNNKTLIFCYLLDNNEYKQKIFDFAMNINNINENNPFLFENLSNTFFNYDVNKNNLSFMSFNSNYSDDSNDSDNSDDCDNSDDSDESNNSDNSDDSDN